MDIILPAGLPIAPLKPEIKFTPNVHLAEVEKHYIIAALKFHKTKRKAATSLGITLRTLYNKLHEHGLWDEYRDRPEPITGDYKSEVNFRHGNWDLLTKHNIVIALLILKALNNKQIAVQLGLSHNSVNRYVSIIYKKTGVNTRHEFIVKFSKTGQ